MRMDLSKRQVEIIEASGKILMDKGILGLTTKNLANEMNFSESALYRHFKNKEDIIILLIRYLSENIASRFEEILNSNLKPEEKLMAFFKSQLTFFKSNPHFIVIVLSEGLVDNYESVKNEIMQLMQKNSIAFTKVIQEGQSAKEFNPEIDTEDLVHFTMGTFRLQMLKWKLSNFGFDIEEKGMKIMKNLLTLMK